MRTGVTLRITGTADNQTFADLVSDVNDALTAAGLDERLIAVGLGGKLAIGPTAASNVTALQIGDHQGTTTTVTALGYEVDQVIGLAVLKGDRPAVSLVAGEAPAAINVNDADGAFAITIDGTAHGITISGTSDNTSVADLVSDINDAFALAGIDSLIEAVETAQGPIAIQPKTGVEIESLQLNGTTVVGKLGFEVQQSAHYTVMTSDATFRLSVNGNSFVQVDLAAGETSDKHHPRRLGRGPEPRPGYGADRLSDPGHGSRRCHMAHHGGRRLPGFHRPGCGRG